MIEGCGKKLLARGWCRTHYTRWYETGSTELGVRTATPRAYPSKPLEARFWPKVTKSEGCWTWTAGKTRLGYGMIVNVPGEHPARLMAHRVAYELVVGPIPAGLQLDHLCRNPSCVNPDHLEPVDQAENTRRGLAPRLAQERAKAITHCPQGHPYSEENTYRYGGRRVCRTCAIERTQRRRAEKARRISASE